MTSALYSRLAATATRLLAKYGRPISVVTRTVGAYNPATGAAAVAEAVAQCSGVEVSDRKGERSSVQGATKQFYVSVPSDAAASPSAFEAIIDGATKMEVVTASQIAPGDTMIVWSIEVRSGG